MEWGVGVGRVAGDSGMGIKEEERFCSHDIEKGRISCMQPFLLSTLEDQDSNPGGRCEAGTG